MSVGAGRAQGARSPVSQREGAELLEQHCCVDGAHRMTFPADRVVEVKRASGVYDFEHETREMDKKKHAAGSP